jgi:hypothetical protein
MKALAGHSQSAGPLTSITYAGALLMQQIESATLGMPAEGF